MANIDLKNAVDKIFWDLSDDSFITKFLKSLEDGIYNELIQTINDTYENMFLHRAKHMGLFSSLFPIYNRVNTFAPPFYNPPLEDGFEYFKIKVISAWMGIVTAPTYEMLNWIAGGYSLQPCFARRLENIKEFSWWLNHSYLDGNAGDIGIYSEPRTWLRSVFAARGDIVITLFSDGTNQLSNSEEFNELKMLYRRLYGPFRILYDFRTTREPTEFLLWSSNFGDTIGHPNGYGDFDLSTFTNISKEKEYYVLNDDAVENGASFETPDRAVPAGIYEFNCYEVFLSNRIERIFEYSLDSGNTWDIIEPLGRINVLSAGNIRFKMTLKYIKDIKLYRFVSMMLRKEV